ncbi:MAG: DUF45 domain-containing protein [Opitutales bacterium]|nr:DUF45 domain-containing protein [Opitutales bacterium]
MPESFEIALGSAGTVNIEITRSRRAKRMTLRVLPGGKAVVVVPENARGDIIHKARAFADSNALWLKRALEKVRRTAPPSQKTLFEFLRERPALSAYGKSFVLEFGSASLEAFYVFRESSPVTVFCVRPEQESGDAERLLRKFAQHVLPEHARALAEKVGVRIGKISVRAQRSRWGSCTAEGDLSLNWRLVLLPPDLQNHVILHELAHRVHMDHSGEFWDLLNAWDEKTGTHDRELSKIWSPLIFSVSDNT